VVLKWIQIRPYGFGGFAVSKPDDFHSCSVSWFWWFKMSKLLYTHKWLTVRENDQGSAFVQMGDAVMTVPLTDDGRVLFINEYSVAYNNNVLYLPSGAVESGEPRALTANRELQEEAGYRVERLDFLGELRPGIKYARWRFFAYLGRGLKAGRLIGDEEWHISVELIPLDDLEKLMAEGRLLDATVIAALFLTRNFLQNESSP
jgi:8-oxo-dGTP pyrophosphatase MutT (NUDIX family)